MDAKVYQHIARKFDAYLRCIESPESGWTNKHKESIEFIVENHLPHGSGIDSGVSFDFANSAPNKLIFTFGYHHMDENGYYDGWTEHKCIVTPSLLFGMDIKITGSNRNDIKEYLYQVFEFALNETVDE